LLGVVNVSILSMVNIVVRYIDVSVARSPIHSRILIMKTPRATETTTPQFPSWRPLAFHQARPELVPHIMRFDPAVHLALCKASSVAGNYFYAADRAGKPHDRSVGSPFRGATNLWHG